MFDQTELTLIAQMAEDVASKNREGADYLASTPEDAERFAGAIQNMRTIARWHDEIARKARAGREGSPGPSSPAPADEQASEGLTIPGSALYRTDADGRPLTEPESIAQEPRADMLARVHRSFCGLFPDHPGACRPLTEHLTRHPVQVVVDGTVIAETNRVSLDEGERSMDTPAWAIGLTERLCRSGQLCSRDLPCGLSECHTPKRWPIESDEHYRERLLSLPRHGDMYADD